MARVRAGEAANPAPPTVQRIRVRFAKRGRVRFLSHRDVARSMERAVRRAGIPVAHSHGFSPHPRLSWVGAAPTGAASEAEYLEIGLTRPVDPAALVAALDAALPPGLDVLDAAEAEGAALAERIEASRWRLELPGVAADALADALGALLDRDTLVVERVTPSGRKQVDVRAALVAATVVDPAAEGVAPRTPGRDPAAAGGPIAGPSDPATDGDGPDASTSPPPSITTDGSDPAVTDTAVTTSAARPGCAILTAVVRQTTPAVRPDDVLGALDAVAGLRPPVPAKATRMAQGLLDERGDLIEPLGSGRVTIRS